MDKKSLIKSAYLDFRDGNWDHAAQKYRQLVDLDPMDTTNLTLLGDIMARKNQFMEALHYYKQAWLILKSAGAENKLEVIQRKMLKLDPDYLQTIAAEEAEETPAPASEPPNIEKLKQAIAADNKNLDHYQKLGDTLAKAGRKKEAGEQYLVIGNALFNNRMYKKAEPIFKQIIEWSPNHLQAHISLGEIYAKEGSDSDAKKEFLVVAEQYVREGNLERGQLFAQRAIQMKSIEAHYYLGLIHFQKNQMEEAQKEFETLLKFKVNHQGALTYLAKIYTQAHRWDETFKIYERLVKIDSKNADAFEKMGEIALGQNNLEVAKEKFVQAMEAFATEEQWERTAACANQAVKLAPQEQELYLKLADASYNAGLEQQAAEACLALANVLDAEGKSKEAEDMRMKARELTGESAPPTPAGKVSPPPPAATIPAAAPTSTATKKGAAVSQSEVQMLMNIADNYVQQGSLDEAIDVYQKILKTDPNNEKVKNALTRVYAMFAGINPATAVAKKAVSAKDLPESGSEREEQRVQREARERALREAQLRSQRNAPVEESQKPKSRTRENEFLQAVSQTREDEIGGDNQDEFMTVTVAEIYTKQGLLNEALKIYQKILEIEPGNVEAQSKKKELENKMAEQERLRQQSEQAAPRKEPSKGEKLSQTKATGAEDKKASKSDSTKSKSDDQEPPPSGKGHRGRVSYV